MEYKDNNLYVDIENFQHKMKLYNNKNPRIRLHLGKIHPEEFEVTVETIKLLPEEQEQQVRNYVRSIFI